MRIGKKSRLSANESLISVIIPVYNAGKYLEKAVESALSQKGVRLEVIAINDASTDDSLKRLKDIGSRHGSILNIIDLNENIGQARARNIGINAASGDYVAFLDADDYYNGDFVLNKWSDAAKKSDADLTCSNFDRVDNNSRPLPSPKFLDGVANGTTTLSKSPELVNLQACWQLLYSKKFIDKHSIRFSEQLRQREDRLFFVKCLLLADRIEITHIKSIAYRYHLESTMRQVTWSQYAHYIQHIREFCDFLENDQQLYTKNGDFLKANALTYLRSITRYWAPILSLPYATKDKAFTDSMYELNRLLHRMGDFRSETYLSLSESDERLKLGSFFDLASEMIINKDTEGLAACIRNRVIHIRDFGPRIEHAVDRDRTRMLLNKRLSFAQSMTPVMRCKSFSIRSFQRFESFAEKNDLQFILHLGYPKTGSSAIQEVLEINREELLREDIWYPVSGIERGANHRIHRNSGHARLMMSIMEGKTDQVAKFFDEIVSLGKCKTVILSSESILSPRFWNGGRTLDAINEIFSGRVSKVIAYLRRQDDWLESFYNELASNPGKTDFTDTPEEFFDIAYGQGLLDFTYVEDNIKKSFPTADICLLSYERESKGSNLVNNFMDEIGAGPNSRVIPSSRINISEDKITARLFVEANRLGISTADKIVLAQKLAALGETCPKEAMHYGSALRHEIMNRLQPTNDAFTSRHDWFDSLLDPARSSLGRVEDLAWRNQLDLLKK